MRAGSTPSTPQFLPNLTLSLDDDSTPRPGSEPSYKAKGLSNGASPMRSDSRGSMASNAFDVVQPLLTQSLLIDSFEDVERAEQHRQTIVSEKQRIHDESKGWHELADDKFSNELRNGHLRMKQLDFEEETAARAVNYKRSIAMATQEALARQEASLKRSKLYEKRRVETQQAALREQEALSALAAAKAEESAAKRALKQVGQLP